MSILDKHENETPTRPLGEVSSIWRADVFNDRYERSRYPNLHHPALRPQIAARVHDNKRPLLS
jgi:dephospho-CoA kinase